MTARADAVERLERRLGYAFKDRALLERALTHASVAGAGGTARHNQVLEFVGDRVIGLLAAERLAELFPEAAEGELTPRLHALVRNEACAAVAERIGLGEALRLAAGGRTSPAVLGDAAEALMAAVYLDGGLAAARAVFLDVWAEAFMALGEATPRDPKTTLQEWAMRLGRPLPAYAVLARTGPAHRPTFTVTVAVEGCAPQTGVGPTRRAAEMAAAAAVLAGIA
ncbi:MAG TPA: ribonuclease III [Caulobacteraceae bacterium]|jgi:ribonuclease-3|nr:ribonuclease III [Caulobacteraceae bacterium]